MERILYKNSDYIVILSKGTKKYIENIGAKKVIWLPNGPDLETFKFTRLPEEPLKFSSKRKFRILYFGSHGKSNDLYTVIESMRLLQKYPIQLFLLGDGPEKNSLIKQSLNLKNIIFKDPIPNSLIPNYISKFDCVLVSLGEVKLFEYGVSPNKLYDAYSIGRPVITNIPGFINDEVNNNYLGLTSKPSDHKQLSIAIKNLMLKSRHERETMGINARKVAEKYYSRDLVVKGYNNILKELLF